MIRPASFASNPETRASNPFQRDLPGSLASFASRARAECDAFALTLAAAGVRVHLFEDVEDPPKPDAVFPNNWLSTHADGTVVLYPMQAANRRLERRSEIVSALVAEGGYESPTVIDLSEHERDGLYLEGTGSLVLDRAHRFVYASRSPRTSSALLADFGQRMGYRPVEFEARDDSGRPYYHTNVVLSVGTHFAAACVEAIEDPAERERLLRTLAATGRELIDLTRAQVANFAGNLLELRSAAGETLIVLSERARSALNLRQLEQLSAHGRLVSAPLDTIEDVGGGSARCLLCEVHLPAAVA